MMHSDVVEGVGRMVLQQESANPVLPIEPELCEMFGVSRSVLREAMKSIAAKGLIEVRPRVGTRIRPRHLWNNLDPDVLRWSAAQDRERTIVELNELRQAIEPAAAALAARHANADERSEIWDHYLRMEDAVRDRDLASFIEADTRFHTGILGAGGNELFRSLGHAIDVVLQDSFRSEAASIDDVASSIPLHRAVAAAITGCLPDEAAAAMRAVVGFTLQRIGQDRQGFSARAEATT
ncbi:FadR/GntR family transcriptional regulator [Tessaracoccus terricola]